MSSEAPVLAPVRREVAALPSGRRPRRKPSQSVSIAAQGEPMIWLTGGALAIALSMIVGLLSLVIISGLRTFWPARLVEITLLDDTKLLGEVTRQERYTPSEQALKQLPPAALKRARAMLAKQDGAVLRRLVRTGNFDLTGTHFTFVDEFQVKSENTDLRWALVIERLTWGRFYGTPKALLVAGKEAATKPDEIWAKFQEFHAPARANWSKAVQLSEHELGEVSRKNEAARLNVRQQELDYGANSPQVRAAQRQLQQVSAWESKERDRIIAEIEALHAKNDQYKLRMMTATGQEKDLALDEIVRAYPANQLSWFGQLRVYLSRWREFLLDAPRAANTEGGVFPAIFGTVVMTLLMSLAVVPFGVLAALYLREYARPGPIVSAVRIAINNLAGVPSIVFGVFGLGFFCYVVGASIDQLFFRAAASENVPTFGTGGVLWASLTLALLTLPVVIVTTEEALAAVPSSMREGSYACGASKWQTIKRIVLPRAMPGIMTGMILAMARGAGEVAPLMLVGAMKLAPALPVDTVFPYVHAQRSFMHLGFQIFDLGFQTQNSEAAKPMVFTTTLLLISIIALLNLVAITIRGRLRRRFTASHF